MVKTKQFTVPETIIPETIIPENIINDASKLHVVFDVAYQGDLIIVRIANLPIGSKPRNNRQLADGTTQGSRHILERGDVYDAPTKDVAALIKAATKLDIPEAYIGPVFVSPEQPTADDLTHPEHGNHGFPANAVCAVVYQINLDAEERERRVAD